MDEASLDACREAVRVELRRVGLTHDGLAARATADVFESEAQRRCWTAVKNLRFLLEDGL